MPETTDRPVKFRQNNVPITQSPDVFASFARPSDDCDLHFAKLTRFANRKVTLERIKKIKNDIWQVLGAKSGQSIEEIANPFADSRIRNDLFELYDEAPPHIQQRIRTLYHRVNRAGTQGANLVDDLVCIELLKLRRYEQNAANRRDKSLKQLTT